MVITAKQRSEVLRFKYLTDMAVCVGHPDLFIFVDETGADGRDEMRKFGYSLRGNQPWLINYYLEGSISLFHLTVDSWIVTVIGSVTGNEFLT